MAGGAPARVGEEALTSVDVSTTGNAAMAVDRSPAGPSPSFGSLAAFLRSQPGASGSGTIDCANIFAL